MSTIGNAVGTWSSCVPLRSCAGASTSTTSGSCVSHAGNINAALSKLRELRGGDWEPCEFIRLQEELGLLDMISLHGYIIIKLCNIENPCLPPQFMRLDWGHDGFAVQVSPSDADFRSYFVDVDSGVLQAAKKLGKTAAVVTAITVGGTVVAGSGIALAAGTAAAAATPAGVAAACNATAFTLGMVGAATMTAGTVSAVDVLIPSSRYQKVGQSASMRSIIRALEAKAEMPYDLVSWNCNHFANYLVDVLRMGA